MSDATRLTWEGAQELAPRTATSPQVLEEEEGGVLRLAEGVVVDTGDIDLEYHDDETMIINMGPQHPSTHGVLRLMLELQGETVLLRRGPVLLVAAFAKAPFEVRLPEGKWRVVLDSGRAKLDGARLSGQGREAVVLESA